MHNLVLIENINVCIECGNVSFIFVIPHALRVEYIFAVKRVAASGPDSTCIQMSLSGLFISFASYILLFCDCQGVGHNQFITQHKQFSQINHINTEIDPFQIDTCNA